MRKIQNDLSSRKKAAIILTILGPEIASEVVKHLSEEQVEVLSLEVARIDKISSETRTQVVHEFHELAQAQDYIAEGGVNQAQKVLALAFGNDQADALMRKVVSAMQVVPFEFLKRTDPTQLLSFIQDEHPQTIALILAWMPLNQSAMILTKLPPELRGDVAERIAVMEQTPPEVIRKVEAVLEKKMSAILSQELSKAGGPKALVDLLNRVDRQTERLIIESLSENNPEMADQVKNMMFVFEDLVGLDDRAIQSILKEIDIKDLATALKGTSAEVQEKIFHNMSERAVDMLKEDMEFMGPVKLKVVEESQQKVVAAIRRLEETGEINIGRGEDDILV
ncbi:MAG: flagellar motor switch protein FliG [Fimbriimonadaceae bacterium]|nr:flagellar motor switch protein FliG [Fimbriimonadaceae bacterium]QYK54705.1 MAG: flagellar motor switch protein FliG [Fimbriimonadaceae bacterium]